MPGDGYGDCTSCILRIEKNEMLACPPRRSVRFQTFSYRTCFHATCAARRILVDNFSNSSEQRLARTLLLLANYGKEGTPETVVPEINQETLAGMVGTTRSRVNFFMNKFRSWDLSITRTDCECTGPF